MNAPKSWEGILSKDEEILWQGYPSSRVRLEWDLPLQILGSVFFTGFSIFWMAMASKAGGFFWMFGLLFFFIGVYSLLGVHFWKAFLRSKTHYTHTTKNAFIAKSVFGKNSLKRYPLGNRNLEFVEGQLSDIWFDEQVTQNNNTTQKESIGFEQIENGRDVFSKFRTAQEDL